MFNIAAAAAALDFDFNWRGKKQFTVERMSLLLLFLLCCRIVSIPIDFTIWDLRQFSQHKSAINVVNVLRRGKNRVSYSDKF